MTMPSAVAGPGRVHRTMQWRRAGGYVATVVAVVALWALATAAGWVSAQTLPPPQDVVDALASLTAAGEVAGNFANTFFRVLLSFAIGLILGVPLGASMWRLPNIAGAIRPYLAASYSVPLVVFYPFFIVVLGLNDWPVVALTSVMTTIPISLNTQIGLNSAPPVLVNVGKSLERTPSDIFRYILLPAAWPDILSGIKLSMVYAVVGVVSLEFVAAEGGLGNRIQYYYDTFDVASMYALIILALVLAGVCVGLVLALEAVTMRGRR
jgi:ABC-type nitrate/sulfonate/bicarbonate transport system permease component